MAIYMDKRSATRDVDDAELRCEFLGIRSTLERYGEVLLSVFTTTELKRAYGPVFEVWYANRKEN